MSLSTALALVPLSIVVQRLEHCLDESSFRGQLPLSEGADICIRDSYGKTALEVADVVNNHAVAETLRITETKSKNARDAKMCGCAIAYCALLSSLDGRRQRAFEEA